MANDIKIINAILSINSNAKVVVSGAVLDTCNIQWMDGTTEISKADIDAKIVVLESAWTANEYARKRQAEYPEMGVQLNKIYDDGLAKWKSEMVDPIKAKYPKP